MLPHYFFGAQQLEWNLGLHPAAWVPFFFIIAYVLHFPYGKHIIIKMIPTMSFDLLILGLEEKTTMAVGESLKLLAGYPLQLIKANFHSRW